MLKLIACRFGVMIKNMKEDILCFCFICEELNIINNQHIYLLIEMNKIVGAVIFQRI
jgi:hypothetical protein